MNNIKTIAENYNITLVLVERGDRHCESNGECSYINKSYTCGNFVYIGIYEDKELELISFFHEIGHFIRNNEWEQRNKFIRACSTFTTELECWNLGIKEAFDREIEFSDEAIKWGYEQAFTYIK